MKSLFTKKKFHSMFLILLLFFAIAAVGSTLSKYIIVEDVGEFNLHIEPQAQAYAVYSSNDNSLDFYYGVYPEAGTTLANGKTADIVYHDKIETNETTTPEWSEVASQVKSVNFVDTITPVSTSGWFSGFSNTTSFNLTNLDTSGTTNISAMFSNCPAIETLTLGETFGNSAQTFADIGLNTSITGWTKESENDETDYLCKNISLGVAETYTPVTYCYATYTSSTGIHTLQIYQRKYVPAVKEVFYDGYGSYTVSAVFSWRRGTTASNYTVSEGCRPPRNFSDNSIYTSWGRSTPGTSIFYSVKVRDYCAPQSLDSWFRTFQNLGKDKAIIDLEKLDTSKATSMSYMFYDCNKPTTLDLTTFNTSNVTDMESMFSKCWNLKTLDISSFDTLNVTNMESMFDMKSSTGLSSSLLTIYASDSFVTTNVTNSTNMFRLCSSIVGGNGTVYDTNFQDGTYARIDTAEQKGYFTGKVAA